MPVSLFVLRETLDQGLHADNLQKLIGLCSGLLSEGVSRVPLFVLRSCFQSLYSRKAEAPVLASAVESLDSKISEAAGRVLDALSVGDGEPEVWQSLDQLIGQVVSLPPSYPSG